MLETCAFYVHWIYCRTHDRSTYFFSGRAIVNHGCRRPLACEEHDRYKEGVARDDLVQTKPLTLSSRGPLCAPQQYVPSADSATS